MVAEWREARAMLRVRRRRLGGWGVGGGGVVGGGEGGGGVGVWADGEEVLVMRCVGTCVWGGSGGWGRGRVEGERECVLPEG